MPGKNWAATKFSLVSNVAAKLKVDSWHSHFRVNNGHCQIWNIWGQHATLRLPFRGPIYVYRSCMKLEEENDQVLDNQPFQKMGFLYNSQFSCITQKQVFIVVIPKEGLATGLVNRKPGWLWTAGWFWTLRGDFGHFLAKEMYKYKHKKPESNITIFRDIATTAKSVQSHPGLQYQINIFCFI